MKIYLIGFMGCGKSYWSKLLSRKMNITFFDLDEKIVEKEGKSVTAIFAEEGEEYFRMLEKEVLYMLSDSHESFVMACGGGTPCFFNNLDYMNKQGATVWINCTVDCLYQRLIKEKSKRPLIRELSDEQLKAFIIRKLGDRRIYYQQAAVTLNENEQTIEEFVNKVFQS